MNPENEELVTLLGLPGAGPEIPESAREKAREAALNAFRQAQTEAANAEKRRLHRQRNWLAAAVLILTGFIAGLFVARERPVLDAADAGRLLREGRALFGNQIEAVVMGESGADWVLTPEGPAPGGPGFLVTFRDPQSGQNVSVIAFSGSHFKLGTRRFEILESGDGRVLVVCDDGYVLEQPSAPNITTTKLTL